MVQFNDIAILQLFSLGEPLKARVDLGCNFYAQAKVPDPTKIFLAIGLGFHLEFTLDEAIKVIIRTYQVLVG